MVTLIVVKWATLGISVDFFQCTLFEGNRTTIQTEREIIKRDIHRNLTNAISTKRFRLTNDRKRIICDDYCLPFGNHNSVLEK